MHVKHLLAAALCLLAVAQAAEAQTWPLKGYGYVAELTGAKVPGGEPAAPSKEASFVTFIYNGDAEYLWDLALDEETLALQPSSLELQWQKADGQPLEPLVTLTTNFSSTDSLFGEVNATAVNDAVAALGGEELPGEWNKTDQLWVVLNTTAGAQAGRVTDALSDFEPVESNQTYFIADVVGNSTFRFNVSNDLPWWPAANKTRTQLTLDLTDNLDGTLAYSLFLTEDLKGADSISLVYLTPTGFVPFFKLPADLAAAADYGAFGSISVADVKAALAKAGGAPSAELFVALQFADKTGLASRFDPAWTLAAQQ